MASQMNFSKTSKDYAKNSVKEPINKIIDVIINFNSKLTQEVAVLK